MATTVYDTLEVELQNGVVVEVKPLPIKRLRKASALMKSFSERAGNGEFDGEDVSVDEAFTDLLLDVAEIVMSVKHPELATDRDSLENALDVPTLTKIVEVATGWKLSEDNPKAQAALDGTI